MTSILFKFPAQQIARAACLAVAIWINEHTALGSDVEPLGFVKEEKGHA